MDILLLLSCFHFASYVAKAKQQRSFWSYLHCYIFLPCFCNFHRASITCTFFPECAIIQPHITCFGLVQCLKVITPTGCVPWAPQNHERHTTMTATLPWPPRPQEPQPWPPHDHERHSHDRHRTMSATVPWAQKSISIHQKENANAWNAWDAHAMLIK